MYVEIRVQSSVARRTLTCFEIPKYQEIKSFLIDLSPISFAHHSTSRAVILEKVLSRNGGVGEKAENLVKTYPV